MSCLFDAERVVAPGAGAVVGEGAARAALDGAVGGALAGGVAADGEGTHRVRSVEVEAAACETDTHILMQTHTVALFV